MPRPTVVDPAAIWILSHPLGFAARCVVQRGEDKRGWEVVVEAERRLISQRFSGRRAAMRRAITLAEALTAAGLRQSRPQAYGEPEPRAPRAGSGDVKES